MKNRPPKRRVRSIRCSWQVRIDNDLPISDRSLSEAMGVAEYLGESARDSIQGFRFQAVATGLDGSELLVSGKTRQEVIANAVQQIKFFTGYSDDDLKIEIVG